MVSVLNSLVIVAPVVAGTLTFATTAGTGGNLKASDVYATLALFEMMRYAMVTAPFVVRVGFE